jgi:hypothetical protein
VGYGHAQTRRPVGVVFLRPPPPPVYVAPRPAPQPAPVAREEAPRRTTPRPGMAGLTGSGGCTFNGGPHDQEEGYPWRDGRCHLAPEPRG